MTKTYGSDVEILMRVTGPDSVGGFMTYTETDERLYAVTHDGRLYARTAPRPNAYFHPLKGQSQWQLVEFIPDNAEWVGAYLAEGLNP